MCGVHRDAEKQWLQAVANEHQELIDQFDLNLASLSKRSAVSSRSTSLFRGSSTSSKLPKINEEERLHKESKLRLQQVKAKLREEKEAHLSQVEAGRKQHQRQIRSVWKQRELRNKDGRQRLCCAIRRQQFSEVLEDGSVLGQDGLKVPSASPSVTSNVNLPPPTSTTTSTANCPAKAEPQTMDTLQQMTIVPTHLFTSLAPTQPTNSFGSACSGAGSVLGHLRGLLRTQ